MELVESILLSSVPKENGSRERQIRTSLLRTSAVLVLIICRRRESLPFRRRAEGISFSFFIFPEGVVTGTDVEDGWYFAEDKSVVLVDRRKNMCRFFVLL
mmetsp:Transcript_42295/g.47257  ORF Transcript_42295/g.47257 Transcript_42295/m.47257 type:complete len:100 (-) Transcript_42295:540-839(-)